MNKTFYHFLMKFRQPEVDDEYSLFANEVYHDHGFPKASMNYEEISSYLELNGNYRSTLTLFDQVWELYVDTENK